MPIRSSLFPKLLGCFPSPVCAIVNPSHEGMGKTVASKIVCRLSPPRQPNLPGSGQNHPPVESIVLTATCSCPAAWVRVLPSAKALKTILWRGSVAPRLPCSARVPRPAASFAVVPAAPPVQFQQGSQPGEPGCPEAQTAPGSTGHHLPVVRA